MTHFIPDSVRPVEIEHAQEVIEKIQRHMNYGPIGDFSGEVDRILFECVSSLETLITRAGGSPKTDA